MAYRCSLSTERLLIETAVSIPSADSPGCSLSTERLLIETSWQVGRGVRVVLQPFYGEAVESRGPREGLALIFFARDQGRDVGVLAGPGGGHQFLGAQLANAYDGVAHTLLLRLGKGNIGFQWHILTVTRKVPGI